MLPWLKAEMYEDCGGGETRPSTRSEIDQNEQYLPENLHFKDTYIGWDVACFEQLPLSSIWNILSCLHFVSCINIVMCRSVTTAPGAVFPSVYLLSVQNYLTPPGMEWSAEINEHYKIKLLSQVVAPKFDHGMVGKFEVGNKKPKLFYSGSKFCEN